MTTKKMLSSAFAILLLGGCVAISENAEDEPIGEADLAFTIDKNIIAVSESPPDRNTWPKTVTWCVGSGHETHGPFYWKVSWSNSLQQTSTNCISYTSSGEICGLYAMVDHDSAGHTGDVNNPKTYSLYDHRNPIIPSIVPSPTAQPVINQAVSFTAPVPHCSHHCDGTGSIVWQVKSQSGIWYDISGSQDVCTWSVNSSTAGTEIYRLKSTHQGYDSYSNEMAVTWVIQPLCHAEVVCPKGNLISCDGTAGTCSTTAYSVICDGEAQMCSCTVGCSAHSQCDQYCGGAGWGVCVSGCNPNKPFIKYCNCIL